MILAFLKKTYDKYGYYLKTFLNIEMRNQQNKLVIFTYQNKTDGNNKKNG